MNESEVDRQLALVMLDDTLADFDQAIPLLEQGANPNQRLDEEETTPLMRVAEEAQYWLMDTFIRYGADVSLRDTYGATALHRLAHYPWTLQREDEAIRKTIDTLLRAGLDIEDCTSKGFTAFLISASEWVNSGLVEIFLDSGANPHATTPLGYNAMHVAAHRNDFSRFRTPQKNVEVIRYLIQHGVDLRRAAPDGQTPLTVAIDSGNYLAALEILRSTSIPYGEMASPCRSIAAAALGDVETFDRFPAEAEARSETGMTPLMYAVVADRSSSVEYLLRAGCQINTVDEEGWSALFFAADTANVDLTRLLLKNGADQNLRAGKPDPNRLYNYASFSLPMHEEYNVLFWMLEVIARRGDKKNREKYLAICDLLLENGDADLKRIPLHRAENARANNVVQALQKTQKAAD